MTKGPKLKWGDRTAAIADGGEYPIGIGLVGYACPRDVTMVGVNGSMADGMGAGSGDAFMGKPWVGAYYKYMKLKDTVG